MGMGGGNEWYDAQRMSRGHISNCTGVGGCGELEHTMLQSHRFDVASAPCRSDGKQMSALLLRLIRTVQVHARQSAAAAAACSASVSKPT